MNIDFIQEANLGLLYSIKKYNRNMNVAFSTYSVRVMRDFLIKLLREQGKMLNMNEDTYKRIVKISELEEKLWLEYNRKPFADEIFLELYNKINYYEGNLLIKEIDAILGISSCVESLDEIGMEEYGGTYNGDDILNDEFSRIEKKETVLEAIKLANLSDLEKQVIYYLFVVNKEISYDYLSKKLNVSKKDLSYARRRALNKILKAWGKIVKTPSDNSDNKDTDLNIIKVM